jgi:hypothetical protein
MQALNMSEEIDRALRGRSVDYSCYLDADWRFDELETDAWRRLGHEYSGGVYRSLGEIILGAIHDLDAAFQKFHPDAPCAAASDFWRSWQVQRHIGEFCSRLADSDTARLLVGNNFDAVEQAERARVHLSRRVAAVAYRLLDEIRSSDPPDLSAPTETEEIAATGGPPKNYKTRFGRNIDLLRKECGWSFDKLAARTGIDKKLILGHVNDGKGARPNTLRTYADAFSKELNRTVNVAEMES